MIEFIVVTAVAYLCGAFYVYRQWRRDGSDATEAAFVGLRWPVFAFQFLRDVVRQIGR